MERRGSKTADKRGKGISEVNLGKYWGMSSESTHLTHVEVEWPQLSKALRTPI